MKTTLSDKVALILGADTPAGRAVALQLSRARVRTIIAGFDQAKVQKLATFLLSKKGDTLEAVVSRDPAKASPILRAARDGMGHAHFVINACACLPDAHQHAAAAAAIERAAVELCEGKGAARFVTLWPDEAGPPPPAPENHWHSLVRLAAFQSEAGDDTILDPRVLRAAGIADTVVCLLACPPSACPVDVRLSPRELKA